MLASEIDMDPTPRLLDRWLSWFERSP